MNIPILRIVGGALLVLAGFLAYFGVTFGFSFALILVIGGVVIILVVISGQRPRPWDIAVFAVGLLALSSVTLGYTGVSQIQNYSATSTQIHQNSVFLTVSASTGSVDIRFTDNGAVGYNVTFTRSFGSFSLLPAGKATVTNDTRAGVFYLNVTSDAWAVTVLLGKGYSTSMLVSADTGSVSLDASGNQSLQSVSLHTSTGSVDATIDSSMIQSLSLGTSTGSVSLTSEHLGAAGRMVPISLSTSTGSVSVDAALQARTAASVTATTSLGSLSHNLSGFTVTQDSRTNLEASIGDMSAANQSFVITTKTDLGSVDVTLSQLSS